MYDVYEFGTLFCNYDLDQNFISFMHMPNACELCYKLQIPASNTVGGVAETRTVLQYDMVKICISCKGT